MLPFETRVVEKVRDARLRGTTLLEDQRCLDARRGGSTRGGTIKPTPLPTFLEKRHSLDASSAMRSKMSLMNEFMIDMPFLEMPVSGCTCLSTR